ncbi:MAG: hypothetical protein JW915_15410 [Chitinispirillaceae bacterium]|nr:hypothetical protein [Chitinispirillaceae bacterium]
MSAFFASFFFFAIFAPSGHMPSDTRYSLATAQSICSGSLSIAPTENLPHLSKGTHGRYYSKYGPGYAMLFVPSAIIANCFSKYTTFNSSQLHQLLASFTNTFVAALCIVVIMSTMRKFGFDIKNILFSTALIASSSLLLPYSKINHSELPVTLLLLTFTFTWYDCEKLSFKKGLHIGFIMSALLLLKIGNAINVSIIGGCCIYQIITGRYTKSGAFTAFFQPIATTLFLIFLNQYRFGSYFNFGYGLEQRMFTTPILIGLFALITSPSKSMFLFSPLLILALAGLFKAISEKKRFHITIIILLVSNLFFYSSWHDWHGGWSWGPRLIVPVTILMHLYLPYFFYSFRLRSENLFQTIKSGIVIVLLLFSFLINVLGSLIWYQQIYYFHNDYYSLKSSHPTIACKLLLHKIRNKPEVYDCSMLNRNCRQPPYTTIWDSITQNDTISFHSFETFQGFSTFWGILRARSGSNIYLIFPLLLVGLSLLFIRQYLKLNRDCLTTIQEKTIFK